MVQTQTNKEVIDRVNVFGESVHDATEGLGKVS